MMPARRPSSERRILMQRGLCRLFVLATLIFMMPYAAGAAQGGNGQIEGVVLDDQGGLLPGVVVTLRNQDSGVSRTMTTGTDGRYRFPALLPGDYTVKAELEGFA